MKQLIYTLIFILLGTTASFAQTGRGITIDGRTTPLNESSTYKFQIEEGNRLFLLENSTLTDIFLIGETPLEFTTVFSPAAPVSFTATAGNSQVALTWTTPNDNGSPITKYQVSYGTTAGYSANWKDIPGSDEATTTHTVTGLAYSTSYTFEVRAVSFVGNGLSSGLKTAITPANTADGSASNPFIVNDVATLQKVGSGTEGWMLDKHYRQTANIDLREIETWTPIGSAAPFSGVYDGRGFSITNLIIPSATATRQGLFGLIDVGGAVRNLAMINVNINITSSNMNAGGIAGFNYGVIENCYITGSISGYASVGGVAGNNEGVIKNCYSVCNVISSSMYAGGIAGFNYKTISNCYTLGRVVGSSYVGGIAGNHYTGAIEYCVALNSEISITDPNGTVGRIAGNNSFGTFKDNFARQIGIKMRVGDYEPLFPIGDVGALDSKEGLARQGYYYDGMISGTWWTADIGYNANYWDCKNERLPFLKTTSGGDFADAQNPISITLKDAMLPEITSHPWAASYTQGATAALLSVTARISDEGEPSYQWFRNTVNNNTTGTAISGATNNTYRPSTATIGTTYYYVVVTNTNNNVDGTKKRSTTSIVVPIYINALVNAATPVITAQPISATYNLNATATALTMPTTISDAGVRTYQWYRNSENSNAGGTAISGATGNYVPPTNVAGTIYYYCVVTNTNNNVNGAKTATATSNTASITVFAPDGSAERPFLIYDVTTLSMAGHGGGAYSSWTRDKHYRQIADIDLTGEAVSFRAKGTWDLPFIGTFDGGGFSITGLRTETIVYNEGMFGCVGYGGVVKNVSLINVNIRAADYSDMNIRYFGGGIAGINEGIIQNCYVTGTVDCNERRNGWGAGGIAGFNYGTIKNCYTTCNVTGHTSEAGGIVALNNSNGIVENCFATGKITGEYFGGGIVGNNEGTVRNCVALNSEICVDKDWWGTPTVGRIVGSIGWNHFGTLSNNYARQYGMVLRYKDGQWSISGMTTEDKNGGNVAANDYHGTNTRRWWFDYAHFSYAYWDFYDGNHLPWLKTTTGGAFSKPQNPTVQ